MISKPHWTFRKCRTVLPGRGALVLTLAAGLLLTGVAAAPARADQQKNHDYPSFAHQGPPKLLRDTVMRATPDYVVWSVPGATRVGRERFHIPQKMWMRGRLRPTPENAAVPVSQAHQTPNAAIDLSAAGDEREGFQVVITPRRGDVKVGRAQISDLTGEQGTIPADRIQVHRVGYLWGLNERKDKPDEKLGPYADVLLPLADAPITVKQGRNHALYFLIHVPPKTPRGDYQGTVTLHVGGQALKPLPVKLHVFGYTLPHHTAVATGLFGIGDRSMTYQYGPPWKKRYRRVYMAYMDNMAAHRFSPRRTPPLPRVHWEKFPVQVKGRSGKAMDFKNGRALKLASPRFEKMRKGFTVGFYLHTAKKTLGRFLDHQTRTSGYWISLNDGKLTGGIGLGGVPGKPHGWSRWKKGSRPAQSKLQRTLDAPYPDDGGWHHVAFSYEPGAMALFVDGERVAHKSIDREMSPSWIIPTLKGPRFQIDELRWTRGALTAKQVHRQMNSTGKADDTLEAYTFDQPEFDFASKVRKGDPVDLDRQYMFQWADWAGKRGLYLNQIGEAPGGSADLDAFKRYDRLFWQPLRQRGLLHRSYLRLPNDEAKVGPEGAENRRWAKKMRQVAPRIRLYHTFGGVGGGGAKKKLKKLRPFVGLVDIWSLRAHPFTMLYDQFFKKLIAKGNDVAIYIHNTNHVKVPEALMSGRLFFWRLFKRHISRCTLWNVTLWFQSPKLGGKRPERRTWRVDDGFWTTKRNASLVGGMLFYPGENGPINSLRAEAWRDGIEDFDTFTVLRGLVDQALRAGRDSPAVREGRDVLRRVQAIKPLAPNWAHAPTTDRTRVRNIRRAAADAIEKLENEAPRGQNGA